jgi:hypothetical protein
LFARESGTFIIRSTNIATTTRRTREKRKAGALAKADNQRRVVSRADWALRRRTIIRKGAHSTSRSHDSASD